MKETSLFNELCEMYTTIRVELEAVKLYSNSSRKQDKENEGTLQTIADALKNEMKWASQAPALREQALKLKESCQIGAFSLGLKLERLADKMELAQLSEAWEEQAAKNLAFTHPNQ